MSFLNVLPFQQGDPRTAVNEAALESQGRYKIVARRKSLIYWHRHRASSVSTDHEADESTWLLSAAILQPSRSLVQTVLSSWWKRIATFYGIPTVLILFYAAIPFPLTLSEREGVVRINFWFFLLIFYGIYNAVGLLWITKLFNIFSVNWWPHQVGGSLSFFLFWAVPLAIGSLIYTTKANWGTFTLTWSLLTLCTMLGPIVCGFFYTRRMHISRSNAMETDIVERHKAPFFSVFDAHWPRSYTRFLWFIFVLAIGLGTFALGEAYAWYWLATLPHSSADVLLYVYTWIGLIYSLDFVTSYIIEKRIESPSLLFMYKLYYALAHQIYVRNLYARLRSPQQFAVIQGASSFMTIIIAPALMHHWIKDLVSFVTGAEIDILQYRKNVARGFYLKQWAANSTMAAFLGWVTILHFGPNRLAYPYFDFSNGSDDDLYTWQLTFTASMVVWFCEVLSSFIACYLMCKFYSVSIEEEMRLELSMYPDLLPSGIVLTIFVLMNMLMATVKLSFY